MASGKARAGCAELERRLAGRGAQDVAATDLAELANSGTAGVSKRLRRRSSSGVLRLPRLRRLIEQVAERREPPRAGFCSSTSAMGMERSCALWDQLADCALRAEEGLCGVTLRQRCLTLWRSRRPVQQRVRLLDCDAQVLSMPQHVQPGSVSGYPSTEYHYDQGTNSPNVPAQPCPSSIAAATSSATLPAPASSSHTSSSSRLY